MTTRGLHLVRARTLLQYCRNLRILDAVASGQKSRDLDLDSVMANQRDARVFMVQTLPQYEFAYRAVCDGIRAQLKQCGGFTLSRVSICCDGAMPIHLETATNSRGGIYAV